jgi:hypothetical protein
VLICASYVCKWTIVTPKMATPFPLEVIDEQSEEDEQEEWQTTVAPAVVKHRRINAKKGHTKSLNLALLAVRAMEDVDQVKLLRAIMVREYETLKEIHLTREKLLEAERLQKETELKIQQQRAEATEQAAEEERIQQIETAR